MVSSRQRSPKSVYIYVHIWNLPSWHRHFWNLANLIKKKAGRLGFKVLVLVPSPPPLVHANNIAGNNQRNLLLLLLLLLL